MKKQEIMQKIGLYVALTSIIAFTVFGIVQAREPNQEPLINEYCNFEYMTYCLVEVPQFESVKFYNIEATNTFYHFYNLGTDVHDNPTGLIIDGDTEQVKYFSRLREDSFIYFEDYNTRIKIDTILYNDVDEVLYLVLTKEQIGVTNTK